MDSPLTRFLCSFPDFDMALRCQMKGYKCRWVTYSNGDFREGVSLTCDNELDRWQKYGYGCSELLFNKIKHWHRGPFTTLFKTFVKSDIPIHSKLSVMAYIFSYYAIAAATLVTPLNWILIGIFEYSLDKFYLESFKVSLVEGEGGKMDRCLRLIRDTNSDRRSLLSLCRSSSHASSSSVSSEISRLPSSSIASRSKASGTHLDKM